MKPTRKVSPEVSGKVSGKKQRSQGLRGGKYIEASETFGTQAGRSKGLRFEVSEKDSHARQPTGPTPLARPGGHLARGTATADTSAPLTAVMLG